MAFREGCSRRAASLRRVDSALLAALTSSAASCRHPGSTPFGHERQGDHDVQPRLVDAARPLSDRQDERLEAGRAGDFGTPQAEGSPQMARVSKRSELCPETASLSQVSFPHRHDLDRPGLRPLHQAGGAEDVIALAPTVQAEPLAAALALELTLGAATTCTGGDEAGQEVRQGVVAGGGCQHGHQRHRDAKEAVRGVAISGSGARQHRSSPAAGDGVGVGVGSGESPPTRSSSWARIRSWS